MSANENWRESLQHARGVYVLFDVLSANSSLTDFVHV